MLKMDGAVAEQDLEQLASLFRLLADKTRLNILLVLAEGERNVTSLCVELGLAQPTVSHHLGLLRVNNVIANRRKGKQIFYSLGASVNKLEGGGMEIGVENFSVRLGPRI